MPHHPNLDRELAAALDRFEMPFPDLSTLTAEDLPEMRAQAAAMYAATAVDDPLVTIEERWAQGPEGAPDVRLRVYRSAGAADGPLPCLYWIHGGGMIVGTPDADDALVGRFVKEVGCVVVSVDYRLAPEHPDPAPVEDCYAGLAWTAKNAAELGIDPARVAVGGASAGGGLAAGTVLLARDRGGPAVAYQLLVCPMLDDRDNTPSTLEFESAVVWARAANVFGWTSLLGDRKGTDDVSPYAAPARAEDLSGLPPAFIDVGELEVFRDECLLYAQRLSQAGVSTEFHLYAGAFHGFDLIIPDAEVSRQAGAARIVALRRALLA
ncbi:alpha/beta hydrolase [Nonomuraea mangrovi]|uniref:Alpha/beta hydrolase n=1 Tax=Nonomuraea mangrovi TaxID=2316207 RepID=A0ABW4SSU6_9ACTN